MLTANKIAEALLEARSAGRALAIVSLIGRAGATPEDIPRMLIRDDGDLVGGTLGNNLIDELAIRYALTLLPDDRKEIVVADVGEMRAAVAGEMGSETGAGEWKEAGEGWDEARLLFEISRPPLELVICGGGHVGRAVATAGRMLDFAVTVIDDRAEFVARERFPDEKIGLVCADFTTALRSLKITPATHLVIVTRGHRHDEICLREVIDKPARYIGMIGSRRRTTTIREHLRREGVGGELLRRVHAPIGLDIGAQTPEEIALAILAEIILVRRGGSGRPKSAEGPMARAR